jgi:AAA15 family ATPase/GTPase
MISQIVIKDFQSHRKLQIDLDPGVNAIVGRSDVGLETRR